MWKEVDVSDKREVVVKASKIFETMRRKFFGGSKPSGNSLYAKYSYAQGAAWELYLHSRRVDTFSCRENDSCHPPKSTSVPREFCEFVAGLKETISAEMPEYARFWFGAADYFSEWLRQFPEEQFWCCNKRAFQSVRRFDGDDFISFPSMPPNGANFLTCTEPWLFFRVLVKEPNKKGRDLTSLDFFSHLDACLCCTELCDLLFSKSRFVSKKSYSPEQNTSNMTYLRKDRSGILFWVFDPNPRSKEEEEE